MPNDKYNQIIESLDLLGVSDFDIKVYISVLEKGITTISSLARELEVERPTVYASLERLKALTLIPESKEAYSRSLTVEPPSRILSLMENVKSSIRQQEASLEESLPDLMAEFAEKGRVAAFRLFQGRQQFLTIVEESLREAKGEILFFGNATEFIRFEGTEYEREWIRKRVRKKLPIRMIVLPFDEKNHEIKELEETSMKELRVTKFLPKENQFQSSFMIYGYKTAIWNPIAERAIVLDDPIITEMYKQMFEMIWNKLKGVA